MAYALRFACRANALKLLRPRATLPTACLAPMSALNTRQEKATEEFFIKNKARARPLSPHMSLYVFNLSRVPHMTIVLSLAHRATGIVLTSFAYGLAAMPLLCSHQFPYYVEALQAMHLSPLLTLPVKAGLAFTLFYHTFNGVRHLANDLGLGFRLKQYYTSGYLVIGLSLASTAALMMM